ncbi:mitochondrial 2-enoyl thioester reductase, partial [Coemansia aciculifera]
LARPLGVRTINVVRDRPPAEYEALERELLNLGADLVVRDSELGTDSFRAKMRDKRVSLGLNCVGGRMTLAMAKYLAQGATLATYGGMSRQPVVLPTSLLLFKDIAARGFWMNRWYEHQADDVERDRMWQSILKLAGERRFVSQPMQTVEWAQGLPVDEVQQLVRRAAAWGSAKHAFVFS